MRLFVRDVAGTTHSVEPLCTETVASLKEPPQLALSERGVEVVIMGLGTR